MGHRRHDQRFRPMNVGMRRMDLELELDFDDLYNELTFLFTLLAFSYYHNYIDRLL